MDFKKIVAIVSLADSLDYQQAAAAAGMTVDELTGAVSELEEELALSLIDKRAGSVQLTAAAKTLLPQLKRVNDDWQALQEAASTYRQQEEQQAIKVAVLPAYTNCESVSIVDSLGDKQKYTISEENDPYQTLFAGEDDIAFVRCDNDNVDERVDLLPVGTDKLVAYIPARNPLSQNEELALPDLQAEKFLTLNHQSPLASFIQEVCEDAGLYIYSVFEGERAKTLVNMVALGMGVTILPEKSIGDDYDHAKVVKVALKPEVTFQLAFARVKGANRTPAQEDFWQGLKGVVQN